MIKIIQASEFGKNSIWFLVGFVIGCMLGGLSIAIVVLSGHCGY